MFKKVLEKGLWFIVIVNKIDCFWVNFYRVVDKVFDLFIELGVDDD